jgi:hypothetical protein
MLEACGASAVCVHGRTVHQNKQLCGASNGDVARQVLKGLDLPFSLSFFFCPSLPLFSFSPFLLYIISFHFQC